MLEINHLPFRLHYWVF